MAYYHRCLGWQRINSIGGDLNMNSIISISYAITGIVVVVALSLVTYVTLNSPLL